VRLPQRTHHYASSIGCKSPDSTSLYGPSLALARLALEGAGVTDAVGSAPAPAYFVLMWKVWENSMASALRDAGVRKLLEKPVCTAAFRQVAGTPRLSVGIEPDLARIHR